MQDNRTLWAVSGRSFRAIATESDLNAGETLVEGDVPQFPPDYIADAETKRADLLSAANSITADWRTELALGMLSDEDEVKLRTWMLYIKAVKAIDTAKAPDIDWPAQPGLADSQ